MNKIKNTFWLLLLFAFFSCKEAINKDVADLLGKWNNRVMYFPNNMKFTIMGRDTVNYTYDRKYRIVTYVDSMGCMGCKLRLPQWKEFIGKIDSITDISVLFFLNPRDRGELKSILKRYAFTHPICIDTKDSFNVLNHLPSDVRFQTFLLDRKNKVIAIGNPVLNPKVKELYLNIIQDKEVSRNKPLTTARLDKTLIDLRTFDWKEKKNVKVLLTNTGNQPLLIDDIIPSCSCTTVEYSKEPIYPGERRSLLIKYVAEQPEVFYRTVDIYCNTENSPLEIEISGEGK